MANVLITGGSGYLGGDLLTYLKQTPTAIPAGTTLYSLVRSDDQAQKTKKHYGVEPITIDLTSEPGRTEFRVTFPTAPRDPRPPADPDADPVPDAAAHLTAPTTDPLTGPTTRP